MRRAFHPVLESAPRFCFEKHARVPFRSLLCSGAYCGVLWLPAKEKASDLYAGCGIADYNGETSEVSLEWIQALVCEPLRRERGFTGRDVRHVPTRR